MTDTSQLVIHVRLLGGGATRTELAATAGSVKLLGDAAQTTGDKTAFAAEKTFLFGESMYSLRRYVFYGLTAIGATGYGVLKMGYSFDEARAKGIGALTGITGSSALARAEVTKLVALTEQSGLGLSVLTTATEQMLNFGFSVRDTNSYLAAFSNFAGKTGLGAAGVTGLSGLFETVQGQGFMNEKQLRALRTLTGLSGNRIMQQGLHLDSAEMFALIHGKLEVPAATALPELAAFLQAYAAKQPTNLSQSWGRVHAYLSHITGVIGTPVFDWIDRQAGSLTKKGGILSRLTAVGDKGGATGMLKAIDPSGTLTNAWQTLGNAIRIFGQALGSAWTIAKPFVGLLALFAGEVLSLTSKFGILKWVLGAVISFYVVYRTQTVLSILVTKGAAVAALLWKDAMYAGLFAMKAFTAAEWLLNAAMDANPIFIVIGLVTAMGVGLYLLWRHSETFRNAVHLLWHDLIYIAPLIADALKLAFAPILLAVSGLQEILRYKKELGLGLGPLASTKGVAPAAQSQLAGVALARVAKADVAAGRALPAGSSPALVRAFEQALKNVEVNLHLNGEKVANSTFHAKQTAQARR